MSETVIKIENLSKEYRLGQVGTGTLAHDLNRWWHKVRGKEDPYLKIGETNDRSNKGESNYIYALKDINLEVKSGEVLGIIGKNGAGKSTLLKILSKVTGPTTGSIKSKGRIASLLEVGTGFHPELTGRENIYMNGTIMGMTRKEISDKLDEIVEFAGIERYINTPTKRYSSGMTVRLGFAIAAHLEPEILVVDEVLAVGDAEFQKKAIGKMKDVSEGDGRTVLFVSHNMASISSLCSRTIFLEDGQVKFDGDTSEAILLYYGNDMAEHERGIYIPNSLPSEYQATVTKASIIDMHGKNMAEIKINEPFSIEVEYHIKDDNLKLFPNLHIKDSKGDYAFVSVDSEMDPGSLAKMSKGHYKSTCFVPANLLNAQTYYIGIALTQVSPLVVFCYEENALFVHVSDPIDNVPTRVEGYSGNPPGTVRPLLKWELSSAFDNMEISTI